MREGDGEEEEEEEGIERSTEDYLPESQCVLMKLSAALVSGG